MFAYWKHTQNKQPNRDITREDWSKHGETGTFHERIVMVLGSASRAKRKWQTLLLQHELKLLQKWCEMCKLRYTELGS